MALEFRKLRKIILCSSVLTALIFSGCEFGNKTKTTLTGYDTISGYYTSLPQAVSFRATLGTSAEIMKNGAVNDMPAFLKEVMANPTMLYFDDPIGGIGSIRSRVNTGTGIPTYIDDKLGSFGASSSASSEVPGCRLTQERENFGSFSQLANTVVIAGVKARGAISLDFTLKYTLTGEDIDCNPMRARFKSCYVEGTSCSSDAGSIFYRAFLQETFDPYINVGLITADDIGTFRSLSYHATYQ